MLANKFSFPLVGGVLAAIGAGLCCAGPLILLLLGISGSWIGNLTLFEPYRPIFIAIVALAFLVAGKQIYFSKKLCQPDTVCADPKTQQRRKVIFWLTAIIALVFVTSNYWIILFV